MLVSGAVSASHLRDLSPAAIGVQSLVTSHKRAIFAGEGVHIESHTATLTISNHPQVVQA